MISKEEFVNIIKLHKKQNLNIDKLEELGLNISDSSLVEFGFIMFDLLISSNFSDEGKDWINWWVYERPMLDENKPLVLNADGSEVPTKTIEDLWNIIEEYRI